MSLKKSSLFYKEERINQALENVENYNWAKIQQQNFINAAQPWLKFTDDELFDMIYTPKMLRAWMVLSYGWCPSCKKSVPMYNWKIDVINKPWKLECPHCHELFPKNDFHHYYQSGLDEHGEFDKELANRSLLFNEEHTDKNDPLHMFGVDDGWGYPEGKEKWLFAATYLVRGHWKELILGGINKLSNAYIVTKNQIYAHKAGILLDRIADFFPEYDWRKQGTYYEDVHVTTGYISYCVDSCIESKELGLSYDRIFDGIKNDMELVEFLSKKAKQYHIENDKTSFEKIQKNIEERILRDSIIHAYDKNACNYPQCNITDSLLRAILDWPSNKETVMNMVYEIIEKTTAVDGVSGEKGLSSYGAWAIRSLIPYLSMFKAIDENILEHIFDKYPIINSSYRFHIDTWCLGKYYPQVGDAGNMLSEETPYHVGVFSRSASSNRKNQKDDPNFEYDTAKEFLYELYKFTGDVSFIQALYISAFEEGVEFVPCGIFCNNVSEVNKNVSEIIKEHGTEMQINSSLKENWHIAMLRAGKGINERVAWTIFDSGNPHGHQNGMNLGLFAKGRDLMVDLGYPPVQYGGWESPQSNWYLDTAAHNTVVIDRENQPPKKGEQYSRSVSGKCTYWAGGKDFHIVRMSGSELVDKQKYERSIMMIDISDEDSYVLDVFRVVGGHEHVKHMQSSLGELTVKGLKNPKSSDCFNDYQFFKNVFTYDSSNDNYSFDFKITYDSLKQNSNNDVHLRYTDLTDHAEIYTCESWVSIGGYNQKIEAWIPKVMIRRSQQDQELCSTFIGVIEPYENHSNILEIKKLNLYNERGNLLSEDYVAVEITLTDGRKDLIIVAATDGDKKSQAEIVMNQKDWNVTTKKEFSIFRKEKNKIIQIY